MRAVLLVSLLVSVSDAAAQTTNWFQVATFEHPGIVESSGLAASRRYPGVLWTHNDDRFQFLFAVNGVGKFIGAFQVPGTLIDWEDIALDNAGNIYIGDIGADGMRRSHVAVHRVREPNPYKRKGLANIERTWYVRFPERVVQDCEAMFVHGGFCYLISKRPVLDVVKMYRFSLADTRRSIPLQLVSRIAMGSPVSAASLSPDNQRLGLTTSDGVYLLLIGGNPRNAATADGFFFDFDHVNKGLMEGGTFFGNGFMTCAETREMWMFTNGAFVCRDPARITSSNLGDFTVGLGTPLRFEVFVSGCPVPQITWTLNGQPIPGANTPVLDLPAVSVADAGIYEVVAFNQYGAATNTARLTVRTKPDIRITEVMSSPATNATVPTADWWEIMNFDSQAVNLLGWRFNDSIGGLTDPYTNTVDITLQPGTMAILVENLSAEQFRAWWGSGNVPLNVPIITYRGNGLSFRATGDTIFLWDNISTEPTDYVRRVDFGPADPGVTFIYDFATDTFGGKSDLNAGAVKAAASSDIGSPGRLTGF